MHLLNGGVNRNEIVMKNYRLPINVNSVRIVIKLQLKDNLKMT